LYLLLRTEKEVLNHMLQAGISLATATKLSKGAGLKKGAASKFVSENKAKISEITWEQQINLFELVYPEYLNDTIRLYNKWKNTINSNIDWDNLHVAMREVLVDLRYQGRLKQEIIHIVIHNNSEKLISYIRNSPIIMSYEKGRKRIPYLEKHKGNY
jgi:hypothetical protein